MRRGVWGLAAVPHLAKTMAFRRLFAAADRSRDRGEWREACVAYARLCRLFPLSPSLHVQLGNMLKESGRPDEARQAYEVARWLDPNDADIWLQLGHLSKLQGRLEDAWAAYTRSSDLDPRRPDAADELARLETIDEGDWAAQAEARPGFGPAASRRLRAPTSQFTSAAAQMLVFERLRVSFAHQLR